MKRVLFACTTPYQVMGAVSIADGERLTADLLIFGMFDGYEELAERIRDCGLFRDVMTVAPDRYKTPGRKGAMKQMLFARSVTRRFLPEDRVYDTYYSSSRAHIKNILLHELIRRNRKLNRPPSRKPKRSRKPNPLPPRSLRRLPPRRTSPGRPICPMWIL